MSVLGSRSIRAAKWLLIGVVVLALLLAAWMTWTVVSFDTKTLPLRHGHVDVQLYAPDGAARPLFVGLGGAEGGNAWAGNLWKKQRERFLEVPLSKAPLPSGEGLG